MAARSEHQGRIHIAVGIPHVPAGDARDRKNDRNLGADGRERENAQRADRAALVTTSRNCRTHPVSSRIPGTRRIRNRPNYSVAVATSGSWYSPLGA